MVPNGTMTSYFVLLKLDLALRGCGEHIALSAEAPSNAQASPPVVEKSIFWVVK